MKRNVITMIEPNDWRLRNQTKYLLGKKMLFQNYLFMNQSWDHDHCEFCWKNSPRNVIEVTQRKKNTIGFVQAASKILKICSIGKLNQNRGTTTDNHRYSQSTLGKSSRDITCCSCTNYLL